MPIEIQNILYQVDLGAYALPVFQRGYVWNRDQVRKLMNSLYHRYPIGELLVWNTATDPKLAKGHGALTAGNVNLILDGQQRITSLYGIFRGKPPAFFEGNAAAFTGLYFNVETETFEFYSPQKMKGNRAWIDVTHFLQLGTGDFLSEKKKPGESTDYWTSYYSQLAALDNIRNININIATVTQNKSLDEVVEIFNNVNSGGTKLSQGELALARICAEWHEGREEFRKILDRYHAAGYDFRMDWLLRCLTVHLTGQPYYVHLVKLPIDSIIKGLADVDKLIGTCLDQIASRLGLNNSGVLGNVFPIVTMIGYLRMKGKSSLSQEEWNRLMYWYIHAFLWGRYTSSTESALAQDLNILAAGGGIDGLISQLRQYRGDLKLRPQDFWGWSTGARFYPVLYMLTRVNHARDWGTGAELNNYLLGGNSSLEVHHIFPKKLLYDAGKSRSLVNALANYAFLTKSTNASIGDRPASDYLPEYVEKNRAAVESHWIPVDSALWEVKNYERFLEQRRILLAEAANKLLDALYAGKLPDGSTKFTRDAAGAVSGSDEHTSDVEHWNVRNELSAVGRNPDIQDEDEDISEVEAWLAYNEVPAGVRNLEIQDADGGEPHILDLAWPNGIQENLSAPLALVINPDVQTQAALGKAGYQFFVNVDEFKRHVSKVFGLADVPEHEDKDTN